MRFAHEHLPIRIPPPATTCSSERLNACRSYSSPAMRRGRRIGRAGLDWNGPVATRSIAAQSIMSAISTSGWCRSICSCNGSRWVLPCWKIRRFLRIGKHQSDDMLADRENLNADILFALDAQASSWGISVGLKFLKLKRKEMQKMLIAIPRTDLHFLINFIHRR